MSLPCKQEGCDGQIETGWHLEQKVVACPCCGYRYRLWCDETYDEATGEAYDWWALAEPDAPNPWA